MTQVIVFNHEVFGELRSVNDEAGEVWFVASDVAKTLEYRDANKMTRLLDSEDIGTQMISTPAGLREMLVISEPGLYLAISKSRKDSAKLFRRWVFGEVVPSIRKTGAYVAGQPSVSGANHQDIAEVQANLLLSMVAVQRQLREDHQQLAGVQHSMSLSQQAVESVLMENLREVDRLKDTMDFVNAKLRYAGHDPDQDLAATLRILDRVPNMRDNIIDVVVAEVPVDHETDARDSRGAPVGMPVPGVIDLEGLTRILGVDKRLLLRVLRKYKILYKCERGSSIHFPEPDYAYMFHVEKYCLANCPRKKTFFKIDQADELKSILSDLAHDANQDNQTS